MAVAVSAITTLLTPWLIRLSPDVAAWVDRKLPRSLQTFGALYASWLEQLRQAPADKEKAQMQRAVCWLIVDAVVVAAIVIGAAIEKDKIAAYAQSQLDLSEHQTTWLLILGAAILATPFVIGLIRVARYLGFELAGRVFPAAGQPQLDLAAAPRRLFVVMLQLAIVLVVGVPLVAITQPFVPTFRGAILLLLVLLVLAVAFWQSATNLQGHARAGAQALADALARQTRKGRAAGDSDTEDSHALDGLNQILTGLGSPTAVELSPDNPNVGRTLADIKLRGLTGATVLAIQRGERSVLVPSGHERLEAGDVLAVAGTHDAVAAAKELLACDIKD